MKKPKYNIEVPGLIEGEVEAAFPLHRTDSPWLQAEYSDGSLRAIDLKTAMLDAHLINRFSLGHTVITHSVYRLLLTIALGVLADEYPETPREFLAFQRTALTDNGGFSPELVEAYFDRFDDRFWLIHPRTPFLQDASLYRYAAPDSNGLEDAEDIRAAFEAASGRKNISELHPLFASYATTSKCHQWGLIPELFSDDSPDDKKTSAMFGALMYQRTSLGAVMRGERAFSNDTAWETDEKGKRIGVDAHSTISPLRRVVHFLPASGSLYRDLIASMSHAEYEDIAHVAEWEKDIDAETGWLPGAGHNPDTALGLFKGSHTPREALNDSQMSLLFVTGRDGSIATLRRNRFRNNSFKAQAAQSKLEQKEREAQEKEWYAARKEARKTNPEAPFPELPPVAILSDHMTAPWNPFIARRSTAKHRRPLVAGASLSEETAMSHSDIVRVPLLGSSEQYSQPGWFSVFELAKNMDIRFEVRVLVNCGKLDQDVSYGDFELALPSGLVWEQADRDHARDWMSAGSKLASELSRSVASVAPRGTNLATEAVQLFWGTYTDLFRRAVLATEHPKPYEEYSSDAQKVAMSCYDDATEIVRMQHPLTWAEARRTLQWRTAPTKKEASDN